MGAVPGANQMVGRPVRDTTEQRRPMADEAKFPGSKTATGPDAGSAAAEPPRELTPEAKRALAEAEERRRLAAQNGTGAAPGVPREVGGRKGPEPTRYGDWEKGGIASDF